MEPRCSKPHLLPSSLRVRTTTKRQKIHYTGSSPRLTPSPSFPRRGKGAWMTTQCTGLHMLRLLPHPRDKHNAPLSKGCLALPHSLGSSWRACKFCTLLQCPAPSHIYMSTCPHRHLQSLLASSGTWTAPGSGRRDNDNTEVLSPVSHLQRPRPTPRQKPPPC